MGASQSTIKGGDSAAARTDQLNLQLVRAGFRAYYWYPQGDCQAPPDAIEGVYRHAYQRGFLYTNDRAAPKLMREDGEGLGRLLGYVHPYRSGWGTDALFVSWRATADGLPSTLLWAEAVPDTAEAWGRLRKRLHEIDAALGGLGGLGLRGARASMHAVLRAECGNPY